MRIPTSTAYDLRVIPRFLPPLPLNLAYYTKFLNQYIDPMATASGYATEVGYYIQRDLFETTSEEHHVRRERQCESH